MVKRAQFDLFGINEAAKTYSLPGKGVVDLDQARRRREESVIQEALEILERRFKDRNPEGNVKLSSPVRVVDYLKLKYAALPYEVFSITWLNTQHEAIQHEELFRGTLDSAAVYPREIVRRAIEMNAGACILVHYVPRNIMDLTCPVFLCAPSEQS